MNLNEHFGDSYDIVKKSLLQWLSNFGPWAAHPMFTHETHAAEAEAFSRFLGVPLISAEVLNRGADRVRYFVPCCQCPSRSLFLDPDTGISVRVVKGSRAPKFIAAAELIEVTTARPQGLTLVFDQSRARGREQEQIRAKLAHFADHGVHGFAYVSHASFVVLGRSADLVKEAYEETIRSSALPTRRIVMLDGS